MKKILISVSILILSILFVVCFYLPYKEQSEVKEQLYTIYNSLVKINYEVTEDIFDNEKLTNYSADLLLQKDKLVSLKGKIKNKDNDEIYKSLYNSIKKHLEWIDAQKFTNDNYNDNVEYIKIIYSDPYELHFGKDKYQLQNELKKLRQENKKMIDTSDKLYYEILNDENLSIAASYF